MEDGINELYDRVSELEEELKHITKHLAKKGIKIPKRLSDEEIIGS